MTHKPAAPAPFVNQWPTWLTAIWAASVAAIAGFINAHSFGKALQIPVTHVTGTTSQVALRLGNGDLSEKFWQVASVLAAFTLGAALSGMIVGTRVLKPGRRYGLVWAAEGALLLGAEALFVFDQPWIGTLFMAAACGLQNAMASSYLGLVLRTTHLTGLLTDLGLILGHWLKREPVSKIKLTILLSILGGFLGGGIFAARWNAWTDASPLIFLGSGLLVFGLGYYIHRVRYRRRIGVQAAPSSDE